MEDEVHQGAVGKLVGLGILYGRDQAARSVYVTNERDGDAFQAYSDFIVGPGGAAGIEVYHGWAVGVESKVGNLTELAHEDGDVLEILLILKESGNGGRVRLLRDGVVGLLLGRRRERVALPEARGTLIDEVGLLVALNQVYGRLAPAICALHAALLNDLAWEK